MAWTTPGTAVAGDVLTASFWNSNVRDNLNALAGQSFAKNLLYNGAMQIAQRGTSTASITTSGYYTADRWNLAISALGTWTQSVENDAPTGSGFRKSFKMLCSTADASPAASDYCIIQQRLEGYDVQRIAKGTSSAQPLVLSFWVKSNKTGTYNCYLQDIDNSRAISAQYTIASSATWEYKTVSFPADTTGAFDNDNMDSLYLAFALAAGTDWTSGSTPAAWQTLTLANLAPAQANLAAATNNYWQVTGIQLEAGSVSTPFEFLPYGVDLTRCQRYYYRISPNATGYPCYSASFLCTSTTSWSGIVPFMSMMRATPASLDSISAANYAVTNSSGGIVACATLALSTSDSTQVGGLVYGTVASGLVAGNTTRLVSNNTTSSYLGFSAEL